MRDLTPEYHEERAHNMLNTNWNNISYDEIIRIQARAQAHATLAMSLRLKELCWGKV